jgi:hypothetical protein
VNVSEDHNRVPGFETRTEYPEAGSNNCSDLYMLENSHLGTPINVTGQTAKPSGDDHECQGPWYFVEDHGSDGVLTIRPIRSTGSTEPFPGRAG